MVEVKGDALLGSRFCPPRRDEAAVGNLVDVVGERERDDVGGKPVDHRARLLARSAVRLLDLDRLAGRLGELARERRVDVGVELAGRIVRDVEQGHIGGAAAPLTTAANSAPMAARANMDLAEAGFEHDQADLPDRNHSCFDAK